VVVLLADEPDVVPTAVDRVVARVRDGALAARARYEDGVGHPVAFARGAFDRLLELEGDRGARGLLAELEVVEVPVPGPRPRDLDTPEDLAARRRG
jgi:molybdenum cofactor cytidylyltransferase